MRKIGTKKKSQPRILFAILIVLGLGVTVAVNAFAFSGFHAGALQQKIKKLSEENLELELRATNLRSLQGLKSSIEAGGQLVPISQMRYIEFKGSVPTEAVGSR